jgi:prepilin-type N-terminal cleavage/methylation domain-containing protein
MHYMNIRSRRGLAAGFSLVELLISMTIMVVIMGATMTAMLHATRTNETALLVTAMNSNLRTGMDLMLRDLLQVGSGLPTGHYVLMPAGAGSVQINMPGPPGTATLSAVGDLELNAVNPGTGGGPTIGGVATDKITTLAADSTFNDIQLTARAADGTDITVVATVNIGTGPDRVVPGQLIMLEKGVYAILVQVTSIDAAAHKIYFAANDSLKLNQHTAAAGVMGKPAVAGDCSVATGLTAVAICPDIAPLAPATVLSTTATRVRMISYYIDNTDTLHPRLVRRINNGSPTVFDNSSGTTVAFDVDKLQISYDLVDGAGNPSNVLFSAADYAGTVGVGACAPVAPVTPCTVNMVRKINVTLGTRSRKPFSVTGRYFHNQLTTQISLRGMAFVNRY